MTFAAFDPSPLTVCINGSFFISYFLVYYQFWLLP